MKKHPFRKPVAKMWYKQIIFLTVVVLSLLSVTTSESQTAQQGSKTLTAVIPASSPPAFYRDDKDNKPTGFVVDVTNAIAKRAGYIINYRFEDSREKIIDAVQNGTADIAPGLGITEDRNQYLSFSQPIVSQPISVFVRKGSIMESLTDDTRVGVQRNTTAGEILQKRYKGIPVIPFNDNSDAFLELLSGKIDAICCPAPIFMSLVRNAGLEDKVKAVGSPIAEIKRSIAVRKGNDVLLHELNNVIDAYVSSPAYQQVYSKWFIKPKTYWTSDRIIIMGITAGILTVVVMAIWRYYSLLAVNRELLETRNKLQQSDNFSNTIIQTEPECIKIVDPEGNLIMMNRAGLDMIEAESLEQVKGQCVCPLVTSEYRDAFMKLTRDVCSGASGKLTFQMVGLKGRPLWLETHAVPFRNERNEIEGLLGITRDITEIMKAESALKESEENFRTLFDKAADAIFIVGVMGEILDANDVACNHYQYSKEELRTMNMSELNSKEYAHLVPARIDKIREYGVYVFETDHIKKDKTLLPTEVNACYVQRKDRAIIMSTCRDITDRKQAMNLLASERERLAVTLRSIGDGVIVTDTDGIITLVNKVGEELTGWMQEEAAGKYLSEVFNIINETTRHQCENPADKVIKTGLIVGLANHTALIRKDGSEIIIADSGAPIRDSESKIVGVVLVFRDITAQYRLEQEMQKMQKLESLGILAGGLAHDFNNLLTSIIGNVSLAKMYIGVDNKSFERLTEAEKAAQRATDLTYPLLTFAKGGAPIKKVAMITDIVKEAVNFALSGSNVKCFYSIPTNLWSTEVDKGQINQVFNNLIINAIHAMPNGGAVHIGFENITLAEEEVASLQAGDYVRITFHDDGTGIPPELIGKIFDPYFTTKEKGSGLGLSTVFSIIKRHDGTISVDSTIGEGTTFTIFIPAMKDTASLQLQETAGLKRGKGKVLVMDDEPLVRSVAGEILTALGYEVGFARDGNEAVALYKIALEELAPFDLVIMDLTVPGGMGGKEDRIQTP